MNFNLQLFADDNGNQGPQIPEELQGLPNQAIIDEIMAEEGLVEAQTDDSVDEPVEKEEVKPEEKTEVEADTKTEDFWQKKAEAMEKAMQEERNKRKTMRSELDEMKQFVMKLQQNQIEAHKPQQPEEEAEPWVQETRAVIEKTLNTDPTLQEVKKYFEVQKQQQEMMGKLNASEMAAREKYSDYDDVTAPVREAAQRNPEIAKAILSTPDPAEFAYTYGVRLQFEAMRQQKAAEAQQKQTERLDQISKHPRAGMVKGASTVNAAEINPEVMTAAEWDNLDPRVKKKLLMGG